MAVRGVTPDQRGSSVLHSGSQVPTQSSGKAVGAVSTGGTGEGWGWTATVWCMMEPYVTTFRTISRMVFTAFIAFMIGSLQDPSKTFKVP